MQSQQILKTFRFIYFARWLISKRVRKIKIIKLDGSNIQTIASHLVEGISKSFTDEAREFGGVPLKCHILADCFLNLQQVKEGCCTRLMTKAVMVRAVFNRETDVTE